MPYRYKIKLYPQLLKTREGIDLNCSLETVKEIAESYNKNAVIATNGKRINTEEITVENGNTIVLILESEVWLQYPTKALHSFISKLAKVSPFTELITSNGRLFRGEFEFLESEETENKNEKTLSDEETLILVTQLFFRETQENRKKIDDIKKILGGGCLDV